ncbi:3-keto-disaccharide hydrolase [Foetidibacter luteolus]|uniref:3-keto-disaccharide hydrolase n=1 Tax=Foetidibacter luteolus TaxID=2608880 RepID=UPI00129AFE56|nr:DUF1080 domain-containing protein [Foetidibacter luteolus]
MLQKKFTAVICTAALAVVLAGSGCQSATTDEVSTGADSTAAPAETQGGFVSIFDGQSFKGWEADTGFWRVENGTLVGEVTEAKPLKNNTFLIWRGGTPGDFELKAEYRISPEGNSGIQYRSEELPDIKYALKGYQADIDGANTYTGQNYEERKRGFLAMRGQSVVLKPNEKPVITGSVGNTDSLKALIKVNDWNEIHIIAKGNKMQHFINGTLMSEAVDEDSTNSKASGLLGFQVHVMPKMKVEYRNIQLKQ